MLKTPSIVAAATLSLLSPTSGSERFLIIYLLINNIHMLVIEWMMTILEQALLLSPKCRAIFIEKVLASFDQPVKSYCGWKKEEDRISTYEAGQLKAIPAEEVFKKYISS